MLVLSIPLAEAFDEAEGKFVTSSCLILELEHSLVSLSKWESKWEIPFLGKEKTSEQTIDYVRMMILGAQPAEEDFAHLTAANIEDVKNYINAKMTASWFNEKKQPRRSQETVTAEIIYYWMISLGIPFECQYWHLNRLLTLIRVCNIKNAPKQKMSKAEVIAQQRALNEQRRRQTGSRG